MATDWILRSGPTSAHLYFSAHTGPVTYPLNLGYTTIPGKTLESFRQVHNPLDGQVVCGKQDISQCQSTKTINFNFVFSHNKVGAYALKNSIAFFIPPGITKFSAQVTQRTSNTQLYIVANLGATPKTGTKFDEYSWSVNDLSKHIGSDVVHKITSQTKEFIAYSNPSTDPDNHTRNSVEGKWLYLYFPSLTNIVSVELFAQAWLEPFKEWYSTLITKDWANFDSKKPNFFYGDNQGGVQPDTDDVSGWLDSEVIYKPEEEGDYIIEFKSIEGYPTPRQIRFSYSKDDPKLYTIDYTRTDNNIPITDWKQDGETVSSLPPGKYTIEFKTIENFATPYPITFTINGSDDIKRTGYYRDHRPGIVMFLDPARARSKGAGWQLEQMG